MTGHEAIHKILDMLKAAGWTELGYTQNTTTRILSTDKVVGEVRKFKHRQRWSKGVHRVTIGPQSTSFFIVLNHGPRDFVTLKTVNLEAIAKEIETRNGQ